MGLSQTTLGGGFGPQPEYSGRRFWASAKVFLEGVLGLSQSTLGGGFGLEPVYSGGRPLAPAILLQGLKSAILWGSKSIIFE